jgi:V/A-type H+-transporting ATPase subunit E
VAFENLLKSVEESAQEKELELRNKAAFATEEIRQRAKKQAEAVRLAQIDEASKSVSTERNKLLYLTKAENKELLISTREAAFDNAFRDAEAHLAGLRSDPKYPAVFERLVKEAAGAMGGEAFEIHIDPRDDALCRSVLASLGITAEIRTDLKTAGGAVVSRPDNSVVISNTVESRLQRARELRRIEIHAILSGD